MGTEPLFVCIKDKESCLWLQGVRKLTEATVSRSEQLCTIKERLQAADINTKSNIPNLDLPAFTAWLSAVDADDKELAPLSAQELAQTLTAADFLKDVALLRDVAAAQRSRVLAIRPWSAKEGILHEPRGGSSQVYFSTDGDGPMRWFQQLAADLPEAVLWTLLREAVGSPKHIGAADMDDWLLALPLQQIAFCARACVPCIYTRGAFHVHVADDIKARRVAELVGDLQRELREKVVDGVNVELREVFLKLPSHQHGAAMPGPGLERLLGTVCVLPQLRTLHLGLHPSNLNAKTIMCIARNLQAASGLESLAIEAFPTEPQLPVVDSTVGKEAEGSAATGNLTPLQRELWEAFTDMQSLEALKLVNLRGFDEAFGVALRKSLPMMPALRRLHVVDSIFQRDVNAILKQSRGGLPDLMHIHMGATPANNAVITRRGADGVPEVADAEPVRAKESARVRQTYRRVPSDAGAASSSEVYILAPPGWEVVGAEVAVTSINVDLGPHLLQKLTEVTLRDFHLDGGVWGPIDEDPLDLRHGLRFPSAECAAILLSPQTFLTRLFLGGSVQPHDDFTGNALAGVLAGLPSLRGLGLRATGMPPATLDPVVDLPWEALPDCVQTWCETWAPALVRLLRARDGHAVPLDQLSLELLHPLGPAAGIAPAEVAEEYTADVGSVVAAVGGLTGLTSLDLSVNPRAVVPDLHVNALSQCLSSLSRLRWLRLAMPWEPATSGDKLFRCLRKLSQLTELQLRLESRTGAAMGMKSLRNVILGIERASAAACKAGSVACEDSASAEAFGLASLRVVRLGPYAKGFEHAVQQVRRMGRHWQTAKGTSSLLGAVCVAAQDAEWLASVGELDHVVGSACDRLYVVLG